MNTLKLDHLASMVAAPIIWSAHFLLCYVLVSLACAQGWQELQMFNMNPAEVGILIVSVISLALIGYTAALNIDKYRNAPTDPSGAYDISGFIALNSVLLCGLSTVALVWVAFPAVMLPTCAA